MTTAIGLDARHAPWQPGTSPVEQVEEAAARGLGGLFFRTMLDMSPTLDPGELREIREHADRHGLYLESGLGKVNPYCLSETPEIRAVGDGDTMLGFRRIIEAAAAIGVSELWVATGSYQRYGGRFTYDRYRTDAPWPDQLAATERLLHRLAPVARAHGIHLNAETHEEITSFELVRLVESVGPDVMGITLDTGNPLQRAEHPVRTAHRVAPYVRQTHLKDVVLFFAPDGIRAQPAPIGSGVVDMREVLSVVLAQSPAVNLSLESSGPWPVREGPTPATGIALYDPVWLAGHPDLTTVELVDYLELVQRYADRVETGTAASLPDLDGRPRTLEEAWQWLEESIAVLRGMLADLTDLAGAR